MSVVEELAALKGSAPHLVLVDYAGLEAAVASKVPDRVLSCLRDELDKVNDVCMVHYEVLSSTLRKLLLKDNVDSVATLNNLGKEVVQLHAYKEVSLKAFLVIVRKCADQEETLSCSWFGSKVEDATFLMYDFDSLLAQLGQLYASWRAKHGQDILNPEGTPDVCKEQTFFVPRSKAMELKVALLQQLRPSARQVMVKTTSNTRATGKYSYDFHQKLSRLCFDSPQGDQYAARFRRNFPDESGSQGPTDTVLLQCSWVDDSTRTREVTLTLEATTGETWEAQLSHKDMPALLAGTLDVKEVKGQEQDEEVLQRAIALIRAKGLRPLVSASSVHYSFISQSSAGDFETAAVDEGLILRNEVQPSSRSWCYAASGKQAEQELATAVLTLRLPEESVQALLHRLQNLEMRPVQGFSVALHGTALFHRQLASPPPPWIPSDSLPERSSSFSARASESASGAQDTSAAAATSATAPAKAKAPAAKPAPAKPAAKPEVKLFIDAKTPLASERTVVRWFRSAVLMASLSGLLIHGSREDPAAGINGMLLGLVVLLFLALPCHQYLKRAEGFVKPAAQQPLVDKRLPSILGGSLAVILAATLFVEAGL